MPALSGSQKYVRPAIAGIARAGASRAGAFVRDVVPIWLNGAARTGVIQESLQGL